MAGTCLIPVDQDYIDGLVNLIENCHSLNTKKYKKNLVVGNKIACQGLLKDSKILSDILFYLDMWDVATDDCKYVHCLKERAQRICEFDEDDISDSQIINGLLTEPGILFLTEDDSKFLRTE